MRLLILILICTKAVAFEQNFYVLRNDEAMSDLKSHHKKIDILIAQAYKIDQDGQVSGFIDPTTFAFAKKQKLALMALITNVGFNKQKAHQFLSNNKVQKQTLTALLKLCKKQHLYGVQFDFEGVSMYDRELLSHFYVRAAQLFHAHHFKVSYAVVAIPNILMTTAFSLQQYRNWSGAYDYNLMGKYGDFVSVMSYDQHSQGTTPGPGASIRWVESTLQYALRDIPKHKLSLGIPVYSGFWHTAYKDGHIKVFLNEKNYAEIKTLLEQNKLELKWDKDNQYYYSFYDKNWLNVYLFVEEVRSFQAKLALAKKYKLRGISVFNLGSEDPNIWTLLKRKSYASR